MSNRFTVVDAEEVVRLVKEEGYSEKRWHVSSDLLTNVRREEEKYHYFLVDNVKKEVIRSDYMQPEDVSFGRNLSVFVDLLNEVVNEAS